MLVVQAGCGDNKDAAAPDAAAPDAAAPDANAPDANAPDANAPDANAPDANAPDAAVDAPPPPVGPVTGFTATAGATPGTVNLAWTNPVGAAEIIIVRRLTSPVATAPADGMTYIVGATLGVGDVVAYAGTGTSFTDTAQPPGVLHYAAFARNAATVWATPAARASALVNAPPQTATITVDLTPVGALVTSQPANYTLAATAVWDDPTDTLTVRVDATSGFARNVFAPKAQVTAVNQGTIVGDGTLGTFPFMRLGHGIAPAGTGGADFVFTGVDGTVDPVTINLTLVDNPGGIAFLKYDSLVAYEWIDSATMSSMGTVPCDALTYVDTGSGNCAYQAGALSAGATRLFAGHRSLPVVREIDPVTGTVVRSLSLDAGLGSVSRVVLSPDGTTLFAALTAGGHAYWGTSGANGAVADPPTATVDLVVVKINAATLTETSRLIVADNAAYLDHRIKSIGLSPDGARLVVPVRGRSTALVHVVDTATMTVVDTDAVTTGVQSLDVSAILDGFYAKQAVYDSSGANLYVLGRNAEQVAKINATTFAITGVTLPAASTANGSGDLIAGPAGVMYVSHNAGDTNGGSISRIDGATVTRATATTAEGALGLYGGRLFSAAKGGELLVFDASTLVEDAGSGTPLDQLGGHGLLFTPF